MLTWETTKRTISKTSRRKSRPHHPQEWAGRKKTKELKQLPNFHQVYFFNNLVTPITKCRLRQLKLERIKDYLLMEEEFVEHYQSK